MKGKITAKCVRRLKKLCASKLNGGNERVELGCRCGTPKCSYRELKRGRAAQHE